MTEKKKTAESQIVMAHAWEILKTPIAKQVILCIFVTINCRLQDKAGQIIQ